MISISTGAETPSFALGAAAAVGLIIILVARELAHAADRPWTSVLARHLAVFAVPLFFVFAAIVSVAILDILPG